jgi:N6-adenosine-specific RNA methylase IME4
MVKPVIYQNELGTITLLDVPSSIEAGQDHGVDESVPQHPKTLLSPEAPHEPYPSLEPNGLKRLKLLDKIPQDEQRYHQELQSRILQGLRLITSFLEQREWCFPRHTPAFAADQIPNTIPGPRVDASDVEPPVVLSSIQNDFSSIDHVAERIVSNPSRLSTKLTFNCNTYHIPPTSTFLLSNVRESCALFLSFSISFLRSFDFILMDPPWPNRSVRHAKTYSSSGLDQDNPFLSTLPVIQSRLKLTGIAAVWVTNRASIRQLVHTSLNQLGFTLFEEWVWMKVTARGEPMTPLDGIWRRPYEVLLLFRRDEGRNDNSGNRSEQTGRGIWDTMVPKRILVAVPNYHSQKPCLKDCIQPLMSDPVDYRALEIFARNLTAGWFSWGDEVLKFNCEGYWARRDVD